jgi:putative ABC transport system substrate-binding protein
MLFGTCNRQCIPQREYTVAGGLMSYGPSLADRERQLGIYAGRILKGENPSDMPVVRASKFEFVMNLQTAKAIGIEVPPTFVVPENPTRRGFAR